MDELSYELGMDPLALRLKNYAERDAANDLPYSTKELRACYDQGAARFGWARRPAAPRSMQEGSEWIGWGMATGQWDALQMFARARATLDADGQLVVESAATDIGTGTYTVMCQIAAATLGLPLEHVQFRLGDSDAAGRADRGRLIARRHGGIRGAGRLREAAPAAAAHRPAAPSGFRGPAAVAGRTGGRHDAAARTSPAPPCRWASMLRAAGEVSLEEQYLLLPNLLRQKKYVRATHSAVFCEVRVDEAFGTVRVTRVVSAVAAGRIISAKTARSQVVGGIVWGISQALHEETHCDHRLGRFMNHNFSEYHVAVNADIHDIDVLFVDEDDRIVSRLGAKGVGEIGLVGVAAAISNAIYHATGRRIRSTPITPDKLIGGDATLRRGRYPPPGEG
jgi:xanthine dehydrogenase YagR molybdenum-binding subunit